MKKLSFLFPVLFILAAFPLFSQDAAEATDTPPPPPIVSESDSEQLLADDDTLYVIADFEFEIKGRTRPDAILNIRNKSGKKEFQQGEEIRGKESLKKYAVDKAQILINQRVLKDNAAIDFSIGEQREDGAVPVTVIIKVEDTWNIVALPRPAYSTNTGFDLTIKARDYNFLGTMNPLRFDLGYKYDEENHHSFNFLIDSNTPFDAFGYNWNINFDNLFSYRPQVEEPYYYQNISGLSMELPFRTTLFTFGIQESINLNEENEERYKVLYDKEFQSGLYMSTKLYASWKIPTGITVSEYGELTYNTGLSAVFNHEFPEWPLHEFLKGPFMRFDHSLGFEKIDWHANYREGFSVSAGNAYIFDFYRLNNDKQPLSLSVTLNGTGHFILSNFFGISSRLQYRYWFYHDPDFVYAGDTMRGIADKTIRADHVLSLNMDFPLRVLLFTPSIWSNKSKLRVFDFEFHASPIIDLALYHTPQTTATTEISFDPKNIIATGGAEFIVFPSFFRSLYIRLGFAWNLRELFAAGSLNLPDSEREIYLMMGHFY